MESRIVADFGVDLAESNVLKVRSVRFAFVICVCKFCENGGVKLLLVDHNEVKFVQGGKVVGREANSIEDIINCIVVRCEDEHRGAFFIAADLPDHVVRSHLDDTGDVIWRKFVASQ